MIDKEFEWVHVWRNIFEYKQKTSSIYFKIQRKQEENQQYMHMHATKNTLVTVSGKKYVRLNDNQITIGFEFDYIAIRFYLFLVY